MYWSLYPYTGGFAAHYLVILNPVEDSHRQAGTDHRQDDPFWSKVEDSAKNPGEGDRHPDCKYGSIELEADHPGAVQKDMLRSGNQTDQGEQAHRHLHVER